MMIPFHPPALIQKLIQVNSTTYSSNCNTDNSSEYMNNALLIVPIINEEINILNNVTKTIPKLISFSNYLSQEQNKWGGSPPGKKGNKDRNFASAYERIIQDYFVGENSTYNEQDFDRRFRLPRNVFDKIYNRVFGKSLFVQRRDAAKKWEFIHCADLLPVYVI